MSGEDEEKLAHFWEKITAQACARSRKDAAEFYGNISNKAQNYVNALWADAERTGEMPILLFAEDHNDEYSLVWEMALLVAMRDASRSRGKKLSYCTENSSRGMQSYIRYKSYISDANASISKDIAAILGAKILPIDEEEKDFSTHNSIRSLILRDHGMAYRLRQLEEPTFAKVGFSHLFGVEQLMHKTSGISVACAISESTRMLIAKKISEGHSEIDAAQEKLNSGAEREQIEKSIAEKVLWLERREFLFSGKVDLFVGEENIWGWDDRLDYLAPVSRLLGRDSFQHFIEYKTEELYHAWKIQKLCSNAVNHGDDTNIYGQLSVHYAALMQLKTNQDQREAARPGLLAQMLMSVFPSKKQNKPNYAENPDFPEFVDNIVQSAAIFPRMFLDYLNYQNLLCESLANSSIGIVEIAELGNHNPNFYDNCLRDFPRGKRIIDQHALKDFGYKSGNLDAFPG